MQYQNEYVAQIRNEPEQTFDTVRYLAHDPFVKVQAELEGRGIAWTSCETKTPAGYRCAFHFWYRGIDRWGDPIVVAETHEIFP